MQYYTLGKKKTQLRERMKIRTESGLPLHSYIQMWPLHHLRT